MTGRSPPPPPPLPWNGLNPGGRSSKTCGGTRGRVIMLRMTNNPTSPRLRGTKKVEIYSTASCHFCQMAKEFFKENGVEYSEYNVGLDTEKRSEMVGMTGQMG